MGIVVMDVCIIDRILIIGRSIMDTDAVMGEDMVIKIESIMVTVVVAADVIKCVLLCNMHI
jgi:hypothetical protein